ncbi:formylglycine-generating enzyme family protein [Capilliphycus salinus ALCB114379]|uniref:formylglycine-generating enzyme family protein n=1 Tax=Capilliphycus salinus TaxID=2768948 RepID=UPI0039A74743
MAEFVSNSLNIHRYKRKNKCFNEHLGDGVTLTLMLIPAGEFLMGAPESEPESRDNERPQHWVRVQQFLMGCYPVTQAQWRVVARYQQIERKLNLNPSKFKGDNRPVEQVSWKDATEFCQRLSVKTGRKYRLPSEAEWEYACRAGTQTPFHFGEIITTDLANYNGNYTYNGSPQGKYCQQTTEVGSFPANVWGLHDLHGNVWEWCLDHKHDSYEGAPTDGSAWINEDHANTYRVLRGGSCYFFPRYCRSAFRNLNYPLDMFNDNVGFRVCCTIPRTLLNT